MTRALCAALARLRSWIAGGPGRGGAVHTAKCALGEGRPVLVTRWPGGHPAGGNRELLAEGAIALKPGDDVLGTLESLPEVLRDEGASGE